MRVFVLIIFYYLSASILFATEASKYIEKTYSENHNNKRTRITVKREHIQQTFNFIGNDYMNAILYGYGDIKVTGCPKCRISYLCILDCNLIPIRGWIIPR